MLTVDLIRYRRKGDTLEVRALAAKQRERLVPVAESLIEATKASVGHPRSALTAARSQIEVQAHDRKVVDGLIKLIDDRCSFEAARTVDPIELRAAVFGAASAARQTLPDDVEFDRELVLTATAEALELTVEQVEAGMYADLRDAHDLVEFKALPAELLLDNYSLAQHQAVLLRATQVVVDIECADATAYRHLFRKLKFRRLLYRIERNKRGYRLEIDGPHSLMQSVTKYGLQLALLLPAIRSCTRWALKADLLWGKERQRLTYATSGEAPKLKGRRTAPPLPEEVATLVKRFKKAGGDWTVKRAKRVLDLPGVGVCVPDLEFVHKERGSVYLEVMGYWSRAAVWKRVELVEAGLPERIIFAVSKHLRVSESALAPDSTSALYVYANVLSAREIMRRLDEIR